MPTFHIAHNLKKEEYEKYRKFFSDDEIKHLLREFGKEGLEDCISRIYEDADALRLEYVQ